MMRSNLSRSRSSVLDILRIRQATVFYLLLSFAAVMGVKYYTSMRMGALEKRLHEVQRDLENVKAQRLEKAGPEPRLCVLCR